MKICILGFCLFAVVLSVSGLEGPQTIFDAVREGDLNKLKAALDNRPQLLGEADPSGNTPLHQALLQKRDEIARFLIQRGADIKRPSNSGDTPLHLAVEAGMDPLVELLISKGADIEAKNRANYTPLTNAVRANRFSTVKLLVEKGVDVNARGMWNFLPLQLAAEFADPEIADYLLGRKAIVPIDPPDTAWQLLYASCSRGLTRVFEKLMENGYSLQASRTTSILLHRAAAGGSETILNALLEKGFAVMSGDGFGWSPLHSAAEKGRLNIVKLLIDKGADINDRSAAGRAPYNLADEFGHRDVCEYLKSRGADTSPQRFPELTGSYMGQQPPAGQARVFAPDIVTTKYEHHSTIAFTPAGDEAYWSGWFPSKSSSENQAQILSSKLVNGRWSIPERASFSQLGFDDDSPFVAPDGKKSFFVSRRPLKAGEKNSPKENLWVMNREGDHWSTPVPVDAVNALQLHWQVSTDKAGNLYFGAQDTEEKSFGEIYVSKFVDGAYRPPQKLGASVNSPNREHSPYIFPDGDILIFSRASQQGHQMGLFLSFLDRDGSWTEARSVTEAAQISPQSQCGTLSADRKYLFYIAGYAGQFGIFWTNTAFIGAMKKAVHSAGWPTEVI